MRAQYEPLPQPHNGCPAPDVFLANALSQGEKELHETRATLEQQTNLSCQAGKIKTILLICFKCIRVESQRNVKKRTGRTVLGFNRYVQRAEKKVPNASEICSPIPALVSKAALAPITRAFSNYVDFYPQKNTPHVFTCRGTAVMLLNFQTSARLERSWSVTAVEQTAWTSYESKARCSCLGHQGFSVTCHEKPMCNEPVHTSSRLSKIISNKLPTHAGVWAKTLSWTDEQEHVLRVL